MLGVLNLYKPKGMGSTSAVGKVKHILGTREVGHMGTLDPAGEGVLLLGVGKATRLFDYFLTKDKTYEADFAFGYETNTLDGEGVIVAECDVIPSLTDLQAICPKLLGTFAQMPPKYSAKSVGGFRAYDLARKGIDFELKPAQISVYELECLGPKQDENGINGKNNVFCFRIHCSSGTYIRSICRDIAYKFNTFATMTAIKRIQCGLFFLKDAIDFDELEKNKQDCLIPCEKALNGITVLELEDKWYKPLLNGMKIPHEQEGIFLVRCQNELFGIGKTLNGILKITAYLKE